MLSITLRPAPYSLYIVCRIRPIILVEFLLTRRPRIFRRTVLTSTSIRCVEKQKQATTIYMYLIDLKMDNNYIRRNIRHIRHTLSIVRPYNTRLGPTNLHRRHRRQSYELGLKTPKTLGWDSWRDPIINEILSYPIMYRNMRREHFRKW